MASTFTSFQEFKLRYPIRPNDKGALLGSGSYGRVIKVEDQLETEWVAIKVSEFKGNDTKSLKAEVSLAQRVPRHANIARYDACYRLETDTSISDFAIMKYYSDGNLADLLQRKSLSSTQLYEITQGILLGLQHLHYHRIVHRDFKPANILISRDNAGRFIPKIADFGLSKLVSDDELDSSDFDLSDGRGTPSYKAPEQIEGSKVSFNLDLWAFGIILYEMVTGEKPFRADQRNTSEQSARREVEKKIITVDLPDQLNQIIEPYQSMIRRCLVRDIHERVRKVAELLDLLDRIPHLMDEAQQRVDHQDYEQAILLYGQVLAKRERHAEAEKGISHCKTILERQHLHHLLTEAEDLLKQQQFEEAKNRYEQVLNLDPAQEKAVCGLALCLERLRPESRVANPERTDVFPQESTDVYLAPSVSTAAKADLKPALEIEPGAPVKIVAKPTFQSESLPGSMNIHTVTTSTSRLFPWRMFTPLAVIVGGIVWYFYFRIVEPPHPPIPTDSQQLGIISTGTQKDTTHAERLKPILPENKEDAIKRRVDVELGKARRAFALKDYAKTLILTNNALQMDPNRQDVLALRNAASKEQSKQATEGNKIAGEGTSTTKNEKDNSSVTTEDVNEKLLKEKREQQNTYDQLIDEGVKAITNGNNKAKAIATFNKAMTLAKENELNSTKAEGHYNFYLNKANKIFATDEFEGAKGWFLVAQALKDTEEVRRKIKQCSKQ